MKFPLLTPITGMALVLGAADANADPLLYVISGSLTGDGPFGTSVPKSRG